MLEMSSQTEQANGDKKPNEEKQEKPEGTNEEKDAAPVEPIPHHISDVDTWGGPDRSYFTFVAVSVLFGFFGLDHFYLRSFGTGTQKLFINILSLGFWYWWDVVQIVSDGSKIRTDGLNSPLDWVRGIGRGVFVAPVEKKKDQKEQKEQKEQHEEKPKVGGKNETTDTEEDFGYAAKKSYLVYSFLAIFFGWLGADKFYMGELWQGLVKLISCFNIFLFLFGWLWVLWDSFHAFFLTDSILQNGLSAPLPYNMMFSSTIPGSTFKVRKLTAEDMKEAKAMGISASGMSFGLPTFGSLGFADFCSKWFSIPIPTFPVREIYKEVVAPLLTVPVVAALKSVGPNRPPPQPSCIEEVANMLPTAQQVHQTVMDAANTSRVALATVAEPVAIVSKGIENAAIKVDNRPIMPQAGGRREEQGGGPGPVIAGALTAVVLAGGLKGFYDLISKQYG